MSQDSGTRDGVSAVARLLAGAPAAYIEAGTLAELWASLTEAIAQASGGDRLAVFEEFLSNLPDDQSAQIRSQVGQAGRAILQGRANSTPASLP